MIEKRGEKCVSVGLVAVPETGPAVLYGLREVFLAVGRAWEGITGKPSGAVSMVPKIAAEHAGLFTCALGTPIMPDASFANADSHDVVIVTDLALPPDFDPRGQWRAAVDWIRAQYGRGALVASVCTGSLLLAEAGLLNDGEATTHWGVVPLFQRCYPRVRLRPEKVLAAADSDQRIITAGGYASWSELALYLIARLCGREEAVRIARIFLLGDRSDGQLAFAAMSRPRGHGDAAIEACQLWIAEHYATPNPVTRMAERSGLAMRTFKRRFRAATGYGPMEYVQTLRVEEAKHLLETTGLSTDEVGASVGYDDPASFRRLFKRHTGITPSRYRQRWQSVSRRWLAGA